MKKLLAIFLVFVLICSVCIGCGKAASDGMAPEKENAMMDSITGSADDNGALMDKVESSSTSIAMAPNQKLIRKIWLDAETENMDTLLSGINQRIAELGGYVESRNIYNGSQYSGRRYRSGDLTVRIPAERLSEFVAHVEANTNITSNRETTDDVTLNYVATESRLKALQTEEARLLEILAEAKNLSELLELESRLTKVRTELEQVKSQLQVYDNQVNYGTVYLNIREVVEYTVVEEPETVWERIGVGFMQSLKDLGEFFTELFVFVVVGLPYLVILGVAITGAVIGWKRARKKKAAQKEDAQ